jgi:predicted amidohydrolase YtcJ
MPGLLLRGGVVWTMEEARPRASALLVRDGRIEAFDDEALAAAGTGSDLDVVELDGRVVLPGFCDAGAVALHDASAEAVASFAASRLAVGITAVTVRVASAATLAELFAQDARGALPLRFDVVRGDLVAEPVALRVAVASRGATSRLLANTHGLDASGRDARTLHDLARPFHREGRKLAIRAVDEPSLDVAAGVLASLRESGPGERHRVEDASAATAAHLAGFDRGRHPLVAYPLAADDPAALPLRAALDAGLDLALALGDPPDPFRALAHAAMSLSLREAFLAATLGGAIAAGDQHERGSLRAGKTGDILVFDRDPLATDASALLTLRPAAVYVAGLRVAPPA